MFIETKDQAYLKLNLGSASPRSNKPRHWIRCPRCIGGSIYQEHDGEYVCLLCGRSYYPDKEVQVSNAHKIS